MICDICKERPATYGDGVSWARCSECQYKWEQVHGEAELDEPLPVKIGEGLEHQTIKGLTSIIMPIHMANYSLFHMTGNCIGSIREHTDKSKTPYELIIVDNGSAIQPPEMESYYADKVIKWEENRGVTKAWNAAIRASFGEYVVLINNDTLVYDGWLENLLEELKEVDLVMSHPMYSLTEPFARAVEANAARDGLKKFDDCPRDFSCVLFAKNLFELLGDDYMFDERLISYCSDVDLYERMDAKGMVLKVSKKAFHHHIADATGFAIGVNEVMDKDKETMEQIRKERQAPKTEILSMETVHVYLPEGTPVSMVNEFAISDQVKEKYNGKFIRCNLTGDRIFLLKDNKTYPIKDPDTYHALGGDFGQEITIEKAEFNNYSMGELISMENVSKYA